MAIRTELELGTRNFHANLDAATRRVRQSAAEMRSATGGIGGELGMGVTAGINNLTRVLGPAGAAYGAFRTAVSAAQAAMERQRAELALAGVTTENLELQLQSLEEAAQLPGLTFDTILRGSTRLQAVGFSAEEAERTIKEFANALALVGGGPEQLDGVLLAITQISAKGKVSAEEINQIAERLPQIRSLMQEAFGTADTELLQQMEIGAEEFIAAVVDAASQLERAQDSTANSLKNLAEEWKRLMEEVGEAMLPVVQKAVSEMTTLVSTARDLYSLAEGAAKSVAIEVIGRYHGLDGDQIQRVRERLMMQDIAAEAQQSEKQAEQQEEKATREQSKAAEFADRQRREKLAEESEKKAERLAEEREKEIIKRREEAARERERQLREVERLREQSGQLAFDALDPESQARAWRNRLSQSLGMPIGSEADIADGIERLSDLADDLMAEGDVAGEAEVRQRLIEAQTGAARLRGIAGGLAGETAGGELGSYARLVNELMGRDPQQLALEEARRSRTALEDQKKTLDQILAKMDQPPPTDVFSGSGL